MSGRGRSKWMHRGIFVYTCDAAGGEYRVVLLPGTYVAILVLGGVLVIMWTYLNILKWKLSTWGQNTYHMEED
jgi:hypothetical protein